MARSKDSGHAQNWPGISVLCVRNNNIEKPITLSLFSNNIVQANFLALSGVWQTIDNLVL
jgi:hypothetical protein